MTEIQWQTKKITLNSKWDRSELSEETYLVLTLPVKIVHHHKKEIGLECYAQVKIWFRSIRDLYATVWKNFHATTVKVNGTQKHKP